MLLDLKWSNRGLGITKWLRKRSWLVGIVISTFIAYVAVFNVVQGDETLLPEEIIGKWQSETIHSQLGFTQVSYTFNAGGSYSNKVDLMSMCEEQYRINCECFWMISDGRYSVKSGVITLYTKNVKIVILRKGQSKPDIRFETDHAHSNEYTVRLDAGKLIITGVKDNESVVLKPFVVTEQEKSTSSVNTTWNDIR